MTRSALTSAKVAVGVSAAALVVSAALPAQAASSPGWRRSASVHYGAANTYSQFADVAPVSSKDAWAVGGLDDAQTGKPAAYSWTGKSWRAAALPKGLHGSLDQLSASSAKDVWAVSDQGGFIVHYNGSKWSAATKRFTGSAELTGVTAFSPSNVWVFGGSGAYPGQGTWRYNGKAWKKDTAASNLGIERASAVSATNMWAIGSVMVGDDSIFHYVRGTWRQAKASALSGVQFTDIRALSAANVWAAAFVPARPFTSYLIHLTRHGWSRIKVPWAVAVGQLTTDGRGGFWLTALSSTTSAAWALHWSKAGHWSRTLLTHSGGVFSIAQIPGTTSLWATGTVNTKVGSNATIWADGRV
jgi:hypothetical protein